MVRRSIITRSPGLAEQRPDCPRLSVRVHRGADSPEETAKRRAQRDAEIEAGKQREAEAARERETRAIRCSS